MVVLILSGWFIESGIGCFEILKGYDESKLNFYYFKLNCRIFDYRMYF